MQSFRDALIHRLATKLESSVIPSKIWTEMLQEGYKLSLSMGLHFDIEKVLFALIMVHSYIFVYMLHF